jgi:glyoxylase-like metal-dependent hydrolase (beta-lactamase superfamily II)
MTRVELLVEGFVRRDGAGVWSASSNVTLVHDDGVVLLVDLSTPDRQPEVLDALHRRGLTPEDIDAVLLTHLHIDHIGALSLFPHTRIIVPEGVSQGSRLQFCNPTTLHLSRHTFVLRVPGHTANDIALGLHAEDGRTVIIAGDLFPVSLDPDSPTKALDQPALAASRQRVLEMADVIVTGHGPIVTVDRTSQTQNE